MALMQADVPPSTAPVFRVRTTATSSLLLPARTGSSRLFGRLSGAVVVTGLLAIIGNAAARATESLAVGIMTADLVFLIAVAGWSSVAGRARR